MIGHIGIETVIFFHLLPIIIADYDTDYWQLRATLLQDERNIALGGKLSINCDERLANDILMTHKRNEIDEAFVDPQKFLPARNFIEARNDIEKSEVFKMIQMMPKGAVLHIHDTAMVSEDWVYHNVTYRDNLYVCDKNNEISLQFFDIPPNDCNWQLLSKLRNNETQAAAINTRIRDKLSMVTADPSQAYPTVNAAWSKFSDIFGFIDPLLTYRPVFEDHFRQGLQEFYEDNILYLEIRTTLPVLYELNGTKNDPLAAIRIYEEVSNRFKKKHEDFVGLKIILAPNKMELAEDIARKINLTMDIMKNYPNIFAGLDLVGQEDLAEPIIKFIPMFSHLINEVKFFFHAGETNWYGLASDQNLLDAILLNSSRIGHGYGIVKHPKVMEIIKKKKIAVEICPISNQVLGLVKDLRNHPANILFASDFPVIVSNDDPGLWGSKALSYDFYEAFIGMMSKEADIRALKQLAINSIIYSSMNDEQRTQAYAIWTLKWKKFIEAIKSRSFCILHKLFM